MAQSANFPNQALNISTTQDYINSKYPLFNAYKAFYDLPDIREDVITRNQMPSILGFILDMRRTIVKDGSTFRMSRTRKFLSQEIDIVRNPHQFKTSAYSGSTVTTSTPVTFTIGSPYGIGGTYTVPLVNHLAITRIAGRQVTALITSVTTTTAGAYTVVMTPINGGIIGVANGQALTWLYNPRISYTKSCTSTIAVEGFAETAPNIVRGNIQKYEMGKFICEDELDNYRYETAPQKAQLFDQLTGKMVDTFCLLPAKMEQIKNDMLYGDVFDLLFSEMDGINDKGFDGLFPTALKRGMFNMPINCTDLPSFLATCEVIMLRLKNEGIMKAVVWCDQEMMINVNKMLSLVPSASTFGLPIFVGSNQEPIQWYNFKGMKDFLGIKGLDIQFEVIQGWEQAGFTSVYYNFGIVMPATTFADGMGQIVPPVEIVKLSKCTGLNIGAMNNSTDNSIWYDTTGMEQGGRQLKIFAKSSFGVQIYGAKFMGVLSGNGQAF